MQNSKIKPIEEELDRIIDIFGDMVVCGANMDHTSFTFKTKAGNYNVGEKFKELFEHHGFSPTSDGAPNALKYIEGHDIRVNISYNQLTNILNFTLIY